ncbi:MAG: immunity 26/phosphotriesterase HocA family protein [Oscillospiraceae bacterium]|nr:immunity 26/phosphotriesterase HocA family protein [Oscillospiraceae bacterium]
MQMLTNEQRECFALSPICDNWKCIVAKPSPYDKSITYLYLDGNTIVKCIVTGDSQYMEYDLLEKVSEDRKYLLPKTQKGKSILLSASTIGKRRGVGMKLNYANKNIHLYNENTECSYYYNAVLNDGVYDLDTFFKWVESWCDETKDEDKSDIINFSKQERKHVKYQEGDVFRFKIGRRKYGYGRIILDYGKMRRNKETFWDILMTKPVVCSVYHIITNRDDVSVDELKHLKSLPSTIITDNALFYGEYEIIGNLPILDCEDYPIMYGNSISFGENAVCYQCGKVFRKIVDESQLFSGFRNNGVSFNLNFSESILQKCIKENSNDPYWELYHPRDVHHDLRNPKNAETLRIIKKQFDI